MPDTPMPDDVFDRLTTLERAQFLSTAAQRRHGEALDRQQRDLDRHADHLRRLDALVDEQVALLAQMLDLQGRLDARQEDHAQRLAHHEAQLQQLVALTVKMDTAIHELKDGQALIIELLQRQQGGEERNGH